MFQSIPILQTEISEVSGVTEIQTNNQHKSSDIRILNVW